MRSRLAGVVLLACAFLASPAVAGAAPGDVDTSFGTNGSFSPDFGPRSGLAMGDLAPDGNLTVAGTQINDATGPDVLIGSVKGDGSGLNTAFGGGKGYVTITPTPEQSPDSLAGMDVAADGTTFVAGRTFAGGNSEIFVAAIDPFGGLITDFGLGGIRRIDIPGTSTESAGNLALDPSGKPVISGTDGTDFLVIRLDPKTGAFDTSFDGDGIVRGTGVAGGPDTATGLGISSDAIFIGGMTGTGPAAIKLGLGGALDSAWGTGTNPGVANFQLGTKSQRFNGLSVSSTGAVAVGGAGSNVEGGSLQPAFGVLNPQGQVGYISQMSMPFPAGEVRGLLLDQMGRLLASGSTTTSGDGDFFSIAANADGSPNTAFGDGGSRVYPATGDMFGGRLIFDLERGRYVLVGDTVTPPNIQQAALTAISIGTQPQAGCTADVYIKRVRLIWTGTFGEVDLWDRDRAMPLRFEDRYTLSVKFGNRGPDTANVVLSADLRPVGAGDRTVRIGSAELSRGETATRAKRRLRLEGVFGELRPHVTHNCTERNSADNARTANYVLYEPGEVDVQATEDLLRGNPDTLDIRTGQRARGSQLSEGERRKLARIVKVEVAVLRKARGIRAAARPRCLWLKSARARFATRKPKRKRCLSPIWLKAEKGPKRDTWRFRLRRGLPDGDYVLYARTSNAAGLKDARFSRKLGNRGTFTVLSG